MSLATLSPNPSASRSTTAHTQLGPILVATDGTTAADAAVRAAAQLVARSGSAVHVLAVLEPTPIVATEYGILLPPTETEVARRDVLERRVRAQLREVVGGDSEWTLELLTGDPAAVIARTASELDARVIVLGLGHHDLLDRLFGGETALHALRRSHCPVFAVPQNFTHLPTRIAIAADFSATSLAAGQAALRLLPGLSVVYLAHVAPRLDMQPEAYAAWLSEYGGGMEQAFAKMRAELEIPAGVSVETMALTGKPSRALLEFAKAAHLDAIVTGSRGAGFVDRLLVGSTATALVRGAACAVLAVPAPLGKAPEVWGPSTEVGEADWATRLQDFTKRNAGRPALLEVDDPEYGAQAVHHGYPFLGAAYDHHDHRVEIMLGEQNSTRHFTRGIGDVHSVDLLLDALGRDAVLRIAHGSGQTILTLVR